MLRVSRFAVVSWSVLALGGCAAISGLDQIQETECAPNCDGGTKSVDGTIDSPVPGDDSQPGSDSTVDASDDSTNPQEASSVDSSGGDDANTDADAGGHDASDASMKDTGADAPLDSGCGPLNTTSNCSACGDKCASSGTMGVSATPTCNGSTCSYTCQSGYLDCNASVAPDLDGCECHAPGATQSQCCTTSCPVQHNNGLGQTNSPFYDCVTQGTYTSQLAKDACVDYVGAANAAECGQYNTTTCNDSGGADLAWCSGLGATTNCVCWFYSGPDTGKVYDSGNTTCYCPLPPLSSYN